LHGWGAELFVDGLCRTLTCHDERRNEKKVVMVKVKEEEEEESDEKGKEEGGKANRTNQHVQN
jgi:hypothetical protein